MDHLSVPRSLEQDHNTVSKILKQHLNVPTDAMPADLRSLRQSYLANLESTLYLLDGLIAYRRTLPSSI